MEIFISSALASSKIRCMMSNLVVQSWGEIINPLGLVIQGVESFPNRWKWAESKPTGPIYCLADDDCLPCPTLDLNRVEELFRTWTGYGILALADYHGSYREGPIVESACVGGIRFIRKGIVTEFPDSFTGCDSEYHDLMTKAGYKSGIITEYTRLHMGVFHSLWQKRNKP